MWLLLPFILTSTGLHRWAVIIEYEPTFIQVVLRPCKNIYKILSPLVINKKEMIHDASYHLLMMSFHVASARARWKSIYALSKCGCTLFEKDLFQIYRSGRTNSRSGRTNSEPDPWNTFHPLLKPFDCDSKGRGGQGHTHDPTCLYLLTNAYCWAEILQPR